MGTVSPSKRKSRGPRVCLTHIEIRRGKALRCRISIADDALGEAGDELGALLRRLSPGTVTSIIPASAPSPQPESQPPRGAIVVTSAESPSDFVISSTHEGDDDAYHEGLRERLVELFGCLCDASLEDALDIARCERARRAEGIN